MPAPVTARSNAWVCSPSLARIAGSNPAGNIGVSLSACVYVVCFYEGPIPCSEESCRVYVHV